MLYKIYILSSLFHPFSLPPRSRYFPVSAYSHPRKKGLWPSQQQGMLCGNIISAHGVWLGYLP